MEHSDAKTVPFGARGGSLMLQIGPKLEKGAVTIRFSTITEKSGHYIGAIGKLPLRARPHPSPVCTNSLEKGALKFRVPLKAFTS